MPDNLQGKQNISNNGRKVNVRIISRVIIFDPATNRVLLVRNAGSDYWYAPGGGWEPELEDIRSCAIRETHEETAILPDIVRLVYTQQFRAAPDTIFLEWFWLGKPANSTELPTKHQDQHGIVESARWFTKDELQSVKVFPKRLKTSFWSNVTGWMESEDPFLGVS